MRQNMLNKKLILAALGFSLTAAACGPGGEGAEPQPVSQQSASQALTANAGGMAASLEESLKFLDSSQLFQSALDGVGGDTACSTTIDENGFETTNCDEPSDPSVQDLEIKSGADELIAQLNKVIFVDGNIETAEALKVTYLLKGDVVCPAMELTEDDLTECKDTLSKIELRLAVTSPAQGDVRVDVLVGPNRDNPVSFEVFRSSLAAELDFDGVKAAGTYLAAQLGEEVPKMPTTIEGRVRVALKKAGASGMKGELAILRAINIDDAEQQLHVKLGAANPAASVTVDPAAKTLIAQLGMGLIDVEGLVTEEVGQEPTPAPGDGGTNNGDAPEATSYTVKARVAALTGKATLKADTDAFTLEGLGWGSEAGTLLINGKKVFEALLNPSAGHKFGLTIKPNDQGAEVEVTPQLDLSLMFKFGQLEAALLEKLDIESWMQDDSISVQLASGSKLRLGEGLEVTAGSLTIRSTAADVNVMASAGMCIIPGESDFSETCTFDEQLGQEICTGDEGGSSHPLEGLSAGACGQ